MYTLEDIYQYSKDLKVLFVEDDLDFLNETTEVLESFFGYVSGARNGVDGLKKYKEHKAECSEYFDLVIIDINMPRKDGLSTIKEIKNINYDQAIIAVSAHDESQRLIELIQQGITSFLMKPIVLDQLKNTLYALCKNIHTSQQRDNYFIQQTRLSAMGEMIDYIANQWLQPINIMQLQTELLQMDNEADELTKSDIDEYVEKHTQQIDTLVETLHEFRRFFRINNNIVVATLKELIDKTVILLKDSITKNTVEIDINIDKGIKVKVIPNEFKHIIINILNNAIDAFNENYTKKRKIIFNAKIIDDFVVLDIIDNAGGIPEDIIGKVFDMNFTTKKDGNGSGVGLNLATMMALKVGATISVSNIKDGVKFSILLKECKECDYGY